MLSLKWLRTEKVEKNHVRIMFIFRFRCYSTCIIWNSVSTHVPYSAQVPVIVFPPSDSTRSFLYIFPPHIGPEFSVLVRPETIFPCSLRLLRVRSIEYFSRSPVEIGCVSFARTWCRTFHFKQTPPGLCGSGNPARCFCTEIVHEDKVQHLWIIPYSGLYILLFNENPWTVS